MLGPGKHAKELLPYLSRINTKDITQRVEKSFVEDKSAIKRYSRRILNLSGFDQFMGLIILLNLIVMVIEIDRSTSEEDDTAADMIYWTDMFGWIALIIFIFELVIRLIVHRWSFFTDQWNIADFIIVIVDAIFSLIGLVAGAMFPVSILRVFRLAKLARVSKVLRVFPELRLLLSGLLSSLSAIFWGTTLLSFCILVWSMVAVLFIHPLNKEIEYDGCERCARAYSSVMQATLTFFQQIVTGDSWGQASIPLIERYPITIAFFIPVFLSIGMAVMNLILGVVVSVAQQAKDDLVEEEKAEKALSKLELQTNLLEMCKAMDTDGSGELSREEVYEGFTMEGPFRDSMLSLDITDQDFEVAWTIMDADRSGSVTYKEFVHCLCTMRHSDTNFMLAWVKFYITQIKDSILLDLETKHAETMAQEAKVEEHVKHIEVKEELLVQDEERLLKMSEGFVEGLQMIDEKAEISDAVRRALNRTSSLCSVGAMEKQSSPSGPGIEGHDGFPGLSMHQTDEPSKSASAKGTPPIVEPKSLDRSGKTPLAEPKSLDAPEKDSCEHTHDETESWLRRTCQEIGTLRSELKDILMDINSKLGTRLSPASAMDRDLTFTQPQADLLVRPVRPDKKSICGGLLPLCCKTPARTERSAQPTIFEIPQSSSQAFDQQGEPALTSMSRGVTPFHAHQSRGLTGCGDV